MKWLQRLVQTTVVMISADDLPELFKDLVR